MKKLLAALSLLFTASSVSGIPDRLFEFGQDVGAGFGNSYFSAGDLLQETLVLDLTELAIVLPDDGLAVSLDERFKLFANLNLSPEFRLGLFFQMEGSGYSSIPKEFFELAAQGNLLDETYKGTMNLRGDLTTEMGATFGTKLFGFDLKVGSSYFMPLFHLEKPTATYTWRTSSDGVMTADVAADLPLYSVVPLDSPVAPSVFLSKMFQSGGLDFSVGAEYPLIADLLIVGGDLKNIPLWPARLEDRSRFLATYQFTMTDYASNYGNSDKLIHSLSSSSFRSDKAPILVLRPFKLGTHATYQPFGSPIVSVTGNLGLGVYSWVYPEFGIQYQLDLWKWLVLQLATQYEDQLWKQKLGLNLNLWLIEFDLGITAQSQNIVRSFGAGFGATLGWRIGF